MVGNRRTYLSGNCNCKRIKLRYPDAKFLFVGAKDKMEMEKVPQAGYEIKGLWISGIQRKLTLKNLSFPFKLISSLWKAIKLSTI